MIKNFARQLLEVDISIFTPQKPANATNEVCFVVVVCFFFLCEEEEKIEPLI